IMATGVHSMRGELLLSKVSSFCFQRPLPWLALVAALFTSACGRRHVTAQIPRPSSAPSAGSAPSRTTVPTARNLPRSDSSVSNGNSAPTPDATAGAEVGYASWYGDPYHGRRAADGEVYDKNLMTAAHRTLPFNTMVKVTNLENELTTTV